MGVNFFASSARRAMTPGIVRSGADVYVWHWYGTGSTPRWECVPVRLDAQP